jgi:HSP20 family protein
MPEGTAIKRAQEPARLTTAESENLFDRMDEMFNAITRRAFEIFESDGRPFGHDLDNWLRAEQELLHPVHVNLSESGEALEVKAEVPGFSEKELEINLEPRRLTIAGKREPKKEQKKGKSVYSELCADQILRVIDLPVEVETDRVSATLKNGILEVTLPKVAKARAIRVQPKVA